MTKKGNGAQGAAQTATGVLEEVRAGVDWISCSLPENAPNRWQWANDCVGVLLDVAKDGFEVRSSGLMGYRGIAVGGCFAGDREDGSYLQLTGSWAGRFLTRVLRSDLHVSRVDLAVTCKFVEMPRYLGKLAHQDASKAAETISNEQRRRKIYIMEGSDGGFTLYIGAPSSSQRGRLYNKEVQSDNPDYERCWRYEVVFKNKLAMEVLKTLSTTPGSKIPELCSELVGAWYSVRGVLCPWFAGSNDYVLPIIKTTPSEAHKKLQWLQTQVKPAFKWLLEHGYGNEAYNALGLENEYNAANE